MRILIAVLLMSMWIGYRVRKMRANSAAMEERVRTSQTPVNVQRDRTRTNAVFGAGVMSEEETAGSPQEPHRAPLIHRAPPLVQQQQHEQHHGYQTAPAQVQASSTATSSHSVQVLAAENAQLRLEADLSQRTVQVLKGDLRRRSLPVTGLKTDLIWRLCDNWN